VVRTSRLGRDAVAASSPPVVLAGGSPGSCRSTARDPSRAGMRSRSSRGRW
jgi:hypothetical protein